MGERLYNCDFSNFLPMPSVFSIDDQSKPPKSISIDLQCFDRVVMFCLKSDDLNDFSLKLIKYLMFASSHFCVKI